MSDTDTVPLRTYPGGEEIWQVAGRWMLAYRIPKTDVWITYRVDKGAADEFFGTDKPKAQRTLTAKQFREEKVAWTRDADAIRNTQAHPFDTFWSDLNRESVIAPWITDPDYLALWAGAVVEGRDVTDAEVATTDWYANSTEQGREWMRTRHQGDQTWRQILAETRDTIRDGLAAAGLADAPGRLVRHFANRFLTGEVSQEGLAREIEQTVNPYAQGALPTAGFTLPEDAELVRGRGRDGKRRTFAEIDGRFYAVEKGGVEEAQFGVGTRDVGEVEQAGTLRDYLQSNAAPQGRGAQGGIEEVRGLINEVAGPLVAQGWRESDIARWAARIETNPDQEQELVAQLRESFRSIYQNYGDNATYATIAPATRGLFNQMWGQTPDETSAEFQRVLQMNDAAQATQYLRHEGRVRGVRGVVGTLASQAMPVTQGGLRRGA